MKEQRSIINFIILILCCLLLVKAWIPEEKAIELRINEDKEEYVKRTDLIKRSCPNDCSGHGTCVSSTCNCFVGYTGTDCSLEERPIRSGIPIQDSVQTFQWKYYSFALQYRGNILVQLNQTSTGDCDLYVQQNDIPTRSNYFMRDITTRNQISLTLRDVSSGTWYFGIYGFLSCSYTIKVTNEGTCPNGCSSHGTCFDGDCQCYAGYYGNDCSKQVSPLTAGTPLNGVVVTNEWKYYDFSFQGTSGRDEFSLVLTQTTPGDADLYVKFQAVPTQYSYDYSNTTVRDISSVTVIEPQSGRWFVGIHGYRGCNYTLLLNSLGECPNQCSGSRHGTCNGLSCVCNSPYSGVYCGTRDLPLVNGVMDGGFVSPGAWNYFSYQANSVANLVISVSQDSNSLSDCDIYAKAGQLPTRTNFDASDSGTTQYFNLTIADPGSSMWFIGVYGWLSCTYTISVIETTSCPSSCSGNGDCSSDGVCNCYPGWSGVSCDQRLNILFNNVAITGNIIGGLTSWNYYSFSAANTSSVHIALKEINGDGLLWVFVTRGSDLPTLRNYLYSDTQTNSQFHRINIELTEENQATYQIGVYTNPYAPQDRAVNYQLIVWAPDF